MHEHNTKWAKFIKSPACPPVLGLAPLASEEYETLCDLVKQKLQPQNGNTAKFNRLLRLLWEHPAVMTIWMARVACEAYSCDEGSFWPRFKQIVGLEIEGTPDRQRLVVQFRQCCCLAGVAELGPSPHNAGPVRAMLFHAGLPAEHAENFAQSVRWVLQRGYSLPDPEAPLAGHQLQSLILQWPYLNGRPVLKLALEGPAGALICQLFLQQNRVFDSDQPAAEDMGCEFIKRACETYRSCGGDTPEDQAGLHTAQIELVIEVDKLGRYFLRARLHMKNGHFPDTSLVSEILDQNETGVGTISFSRYEHGRSNIGLMEGQNAGWVPQLTGQTLRVQGVPNPLKIRGVDRGVIYFDDRHLNRWNQSIAFRTAQTCLVLIADGNAVANTFREKNAACLTLQNLATPIDGWRLYQSTGLLDISGFLSAGVASILQLVGGGKLFNRRPTYHRSALPWIVCSRSPQGAEVRLVQMQSDGTTSALRNFAAAESTPVRLLAADLAGAREIEIHLVSTDKILETLRFKVEESEIAPAIEDKWPPATEDYFPFSAKLQLEGTLSHRGEDVILIQQEGVLTVSVAPPHADWRLFVDDQLQDSAKSWKLPTLDLAAGRHVLSAKWRGIDLLRRGISATEPPECIIEGPIGVQSVGTDVSLGILVYPCPEAGLQFKVVGNQGFRIDVFVEHNPWHHYQSQAGVVSEFTIAPLRHDQATAVLDIYCYTNAGKYTASRTLRIRRIPKPVLFVTAEKYPGGDVYRADQPVQLRLDMPPDESVELSLRVGSAECQNNGDRYLLPIGANGSKMPIRVFWDTRLVPHQGMTCLSVEPKPLTKMFLIGGAKDGNGCYYKGRCPGVQVSPFEPAFKAQGELFLDGEPFGFGDEGLSWLPQYLPVGCHTVSLHWREEELDNQHLEVVASLKCKVYLDRQTDYRNRFYYPEPTPSVLVDTKGLPAEVIDQVRLEADGLTAEHGGVPLPLDEGKASLELSNLLDGKLTLKAKLGEMIIGNCTAEFLDSSWQRLGPVPGQFAAKGKLIDWQPCWFLKKKGRTLEAVLSDNCQKGECANCPLTKSPVRKPIQLWRESARWEPEFATKPDRQQWKRFASWRKAQR